MRTATTGQVAAVIIGDSALSRRRLRARRRRATGGGRPGLPVWRRCA
jgi:hypothetical protein